MTSQIALREENSKVVGMPLFTREYIDVLKRTYCKDLTDAEFAVFKHVCERTGLDPSMNQIYPVKRKDRQAGKEVMTIQTGIAGFRLIAERTGRYAPGKEPTFTYDNAGRFVSATAYIKKQTRDGTWHEVAATAFYDEYVQCKRDYNTQEEIPTHFWKKMGRSQTAKCAEALALRKAFPGDFSGIYSTDEMQQADVIEVPAGKIQEPEIPVALPLKTITQIQAAQLTEIICDCSPEYKHIVQKFMRKINIDSIEKLPEDMYEKLYKAAKKKSAEFAQENEHADEKECPENAQGVAV